MYTNSKNIYLYIFNLENIFCFNPCFGIWANWLGSRIHLMIKISTARGEQEFEDSITLLQKLTSLIFLKFMNISQWHEVPLSLALVIYYRLAWLPYHSIQVFILLLGFILNVNGNLIRSNKEKIMHCVKNEQECIIEGKLSAPQVFKPDNTRLMFFEWLQNLPYRSTHYCTNI